METLPLITKDRNTLESSETMTATTGEQAKLIEITCCKEIFTCKACNVSGRGTRFSEHLMKHLLLLPYKCLHCDESFSLRKEIGAHMQKKHPGKEKKSALRANKRANTILGEAEKKGSCSFKSSFVHISPKAKKKSNDGTLHASVSSSNTNINNSNFNALEPEKNAQVSNTESEEGKQNESHDALKAKSHCEKKIDRPNVVPTFSNSKSESFRVAVGKNVVCATKSHLSEVVDGTEGSENIPVLQTESNVQLNRAESKNITLVNPEDNIVPSKPKSADKTNVGESGLLTNENHVDKCSFVSSFQNAHSYDNQKENSNEDNNSGETNSGNVTASENGIIKGTALMNGGVLSSDVKQTQEHYVNSEKQIDCEQTDETYQDVVPKVKVPAQQVVVTDNDKVDNSPVKNSLRYADDCKYNSVEHATSDKSYLVNTSEHTHSASAVGTKLTENNSKSQTVSTNTCNSSILTTKPKSTVSSTFEMEAKNKSHGNSSTKGTLLHRSEISQSKFDSQAVSNIQQQSIASVVQPSTQIFKLIGPGVVSQYVHVQNVQNKVVIPPVVCAGRASVSAVNNTTFTPVTPFGVINTPETMTSYIVVPLSVPHMTFAPVANVQQGVFPVASQRTVATVADSMYKETQIVPNLQGSHSYAQRIIIQNQNVVPVPVAISGEDTTTSPRNKGELCTSNERVEPEKEYVSEKIEKAFDIVFEEVGNEKGDNEKKADILTAIVGDEYFCGKCRIRWKKKELFWFHLWNHQHIGGILCNKCIRINGPAGELSCAWTDSFISKLQEKKEKNSKMYSIVRVDCTPNVPVNENKATLPADEDKARCSAEENKTSFPTDESEHDSRAQETDNNEQHAEDNDSNDMGLKILECKSLNIEEFDEISSGEQNSVETIKSNSGHGEQEKEKEKENPSDSDNPGQDNLEMCLKNSNSDQGEQEKKIPSDSYNPGQDNLEMCLKNSSSIDDLISEAQKHLPSEKMLSCDESVTMDHFVPFEEELNVDAEYLPNESGIAMDLSSLKNNSEIFSHVQPPAYHFYVCGGTCSFTCLLPGDFKQHLTTCKCINRDLFACFHCRFVGESVEALLRHMHKHAVSHKNIGSKPTNAVFVCSITNCKFSTNILNAFYCHCCQVHPNESSHTCVSCEESFQTAEDLAQHLKVNLLSVVSCKHCMAKDIDKNIVMEHILFEHPGKGKMLNTVKELLCKDRKMYGYYTYQSSLNIMDVAMSQSDGSNMQDSFQASSEQQMEESKKPNRSSSKDSMCCHICNFVASAVSELKQHLTCHEQTPAEDGGLSFICPACPMQVKTLKDFEDHAACHAKNVSFWLYDCPLGDYQTNQVTLMLQHIKKEGHSCESGNMLLGNEKYIISKVITCTCCKFRTTSVAHLNDHMKGHSIITAKDPAVRVAAHSTTDVDATSESVHRTHSHRQNATTTKDRVRHCSKDESKLVKNSTKRRFSSDASKISEAKDSVIFTLPYDSVFQTAVACPQCSFSAFFKTNMLKHIKEKHPMVKVKESSQTVSPVQAKSPKTALSSSNEMCGLEDSNSDKLEGMKLGSSELDTTLATFYKKSGSVLICKICEKQCSKKKILHHHILDHLKLNLWKCTSCDFKDNRRFVIIKHAKNFHSSSDGCVAPVEDFLSRLSEHKCKKGPRKPSFETTVSDGPLCSAEMNEALKCFYKKEDWCLECVVCKMKCSSVILMHKHVLQIHLKHAMFGCNLCWFEGFEEHEVLEHLHAKHPSKPATVLHLSTDISATVKGFIDSCPTSTKSLLLHQNIKKKKLILGNDDMDSFLNCLYEVNRRLKLVCLICKEELSTKYASHRHILAHLGVDLVGCSCCSFQSLSDRDVTEHMKSNHAGIQLKIDYLDVDIAEAVKNFFENSCKTPSKEKKSKGVMHKRQTVERSKATSSTSKVRKPWKGPSSSDAHMGNKKDVTKKIVGGLTKYKCRFCEYLALSVRSVRAHIFRSHPKTEGNLFKCSKCPFQVESLVEITTHMFQKHPWTLEDGFEDCHPSIVSQTNDRVHSTHSGNPFVELEASDSVHSTHSCIEAETSEKDSEEMLLANKPFTEPVSSTKSTLNDGSTDNIQESISMHAENCLKQSYLGFEHITDQVNANEADHSTCKSSGHHHGFLTDTHPRLDKDVDKISDNDEHRNLELCSMDNEVALTLQLKIVSMNKNGSENEHKKTDQCVHGDDELTDLDKRSIMKSRICSGDSDDKKTKERLDKQPRIDDQSMHIDIHERESTDSVKTHNRRKDTIDVGDHSVSNDKTHRNVNHCVYSDITDKDSMASVVTDTKREKSTSADGVVGCKGKKADDLNLYSDIGANKLTNSSTGYTKTKENDSIDSKETSSDKEHNIGNQFSDISDDETTNSIQAYNESKSLVDAVCGSICENTQIDYQGMYSDISDDEITDSTTACSKKRKIDLVDDCASNKTSFNKRHKQKKNPSVIHGDDKKETTLVKRKNMKQKVMIGSPNCGSFTGTKQKAQVQISLDSNITENVQPHKAVLDVGTKKEKLDALFQCSQCSFTTKNEQQSFVRHLKETHNILKYVQCNYCSARYTDTNTVKRHMNFFHKDRCKKYKLLSLSLLFKEVKHEMNKEELVGDLKHVDGISGNKNEKVSSQTCKTKSKKVELIDNTTTSSSLKKHKRISLPKVDKDSSPTYRVDVKEQNSIDKNKSLSSPQNSPVKQKEIKISTALDKDSEALISVQPDEKSSKVILSVKRKDSKTFPMSSPVDHLSESEVDKSTKVLLSFKKKNSPSKQTSGQKGRVLKEKSNKCKSAAASSGGFSSKNKTEDVLEDKTHKVNDENFKYRCKFCNYKDNDTSKMRQHLFVHWHYKPYKCSFCLQGFVSSEKRAIHAKVVHENIVTFCHLKKNKEIEASVNKMLKVFERLAKNDQKMTKIVTKIDQDGLKNEKGLKKEKEHLGNLCTRMSKENSNLANTSRISFKCFYCSKSASSLEGLRIHFGKKHGDIPKKGRFWIDNKTGQICSMSGAVFEDMTNKITYRQSFLCGYCSMRSSKRASVIKHQQFDHSTKMTFIVNLNNAHVSKQRFAKIPDTSDESMAKKIKLVKTLSPNKNEVAESSTKPPASAQSSPTQYCCNHCHHKERSLYHYRRHLASHGTFRYLSPDISQSSALRCGCCNYVASDEKDFSKHVTCHVSGERPYKCGYCSYDAFTRSKVRLHLKSVHSGKEKIIDRQRSRAAAIFSPSAKTLVDIEPVVKVKDIMAVPAAEFGDLLLKHGVTTIDLSYVEDDKMLQILKLFGSGIPEDQLYDLLNE